MTANSPAASGPAGAVFEGQVGAHYLLTLLIGAEPRGLPGTKIERVEFQRASEGYPLDDIVIHASDGDDNAAVLEIQATRNLSFTKSNQKFRNIVEQVALASQRPDFFNRCHKLAVAVGRAPLNIQGSYQDVLVWAQELSSADTFTDRSKRKGSSNENIRRFVDAFTKHLAEAGAEHDSVTVWKLLSRFEILYFDFTAQESMHEVWQLERATHALHPDDAKRAKALWQSLVQLAIEAAASAGQFDRDELVTRIRSGGFRLAGELRFASARCVLAEDARHALEDIADRVGNVRLMRRELLATVRRAFHQGRYVEIHGEPGVGKSGLLKRLAEKLSTQSHIIVLSPGRVRAGGWGKMRTALGFQGTARALLADLVSSGGATLFVDGLDSFSEDERLTVADLVCEAAETPGLLVIATTRRGFGNEDEELEWLPPDALDRLGYVPVQIGELSGEEVSELRQAAPELTPLLADTHPAKAVVRNLFRLERLARWSDSKRSVRTEIDMAAEWWRTADGQSESRRRKCARLLRTLAQQVLDSQPLNANDHPESAVDALVGSWTLRDLGSDRMAFRHDILRDWAVANLLCEKPNFVTSLPLDHPAPTALARGFELAVRMKLEQTADDAGWCCLLRDVSREGMHGSWRRNVLLAVVRSEIGDELLRRVVVSLLADDARLLVELIRTVKAVEVRPLSEHLADFDVTVLEAAADLYIPSSRSWTRLMLWLLSLGDDLPEAVTGDAAEFFTASCIGVFGNCELGGLLAVWFYRRLEGIDAHRSDPLASNLRSGFLVVCPNTPSLAACYLRSLMQCDVDDAAIRTVWGYSTYVAQAAPEELAELTVAVLIPQREDRRSRHPLGMPGSLSDLPSSESDDFEWQPFGLGDMVFAPPSPEHGPFRALLDHAPATGLKLVRQLVDYAISGSSRGQSRDTYAFTIHFSDGKRTFLQWETYRWSRETGNGDPCIQSALMALEAWAHHRIDKGEDVETVLTNFLPPTNGPAAYLLVAVDLVLSHWPNSAKAAIPFVACPELLCIDLQRLAADQVFMPDIFGLRKTTVGVSGSDNLKARLSRQSSLDSLLGRYAHSSKAENRVELTNLMQRAVERLGPYGEQTGSFQPEFMVAQALNKLNPANWRRVSMIDSGGESVGAWEYVSPPEEMEHLEKLDASVSQNIAARDMQFTLFAAVEEEPLSSSEFASQAMDWVFRPVPLPVGDDGEDTGGCKLVRIAAAVVAMRYGDEDLRRHHRDWARGVFLEALTAETNARFVFPNLGSNPVSMAFVGVACLLRGGVDPADVRTLLEAAARPDLLAATGFRVAAEIIAAIDERLPRALLRTAFVACIRLRREHSGDDRAADIERRTRSKMDNECLWLSGESNEPEWPAFPMEPPVRAVGLRIPSISRGLSAASRYLDSVPQMEEVLNARSAALWLKSSSSLFDVETRPWLRGLARSYAEWTAVANGCNLKLWDRVNRKPLAWNVAYYNLVAHCLPGLPAEEIEQLALDRIRSLPDESFFDATGYFLRIVDQIYFRIGSLAEAEAVRIRASLAERLSESPDWRSRNLDPSSFIEVHMGSAIAAFFFNSWNRLQPSSCYLLPPDITRIEPFLPILQHLAIEYPSGFVAGLVLELVEVSPQPEHLSFIVAVGDAWVVAHPDDTVFWVDNGIARRLSVIIENIGSREPYSSWDPSLQDRVGNILSVLVGLGIPQAGKIEQDFSGSSE